MEEKLHCSQCQKLIEKRQFFNIDDKPVCYQCAFGDVEPLPIYPIGYVKENNDDRKAIIKLYPEQKQFMYMLEEEEELCVVFYFHETINIKTVFNRGRRGDGKRVGVFASRTPRRTSRIGITEVKLLKVEGLDLYVSGLDAFQGSPILDIKSVVKKKEL